MPQRFCKSLPARTPELPWVFAGQKRERERAKGHQTCRQLYLPPSPVILEVAGMHRHTAPHTGIAASHASVREVPRRCAAKLQHDHNSSDYNEGDGSHPTGRPASPSKPDPVCQHPHSIPPPAAGEREARGGTAALRVSGRAQPGCRAPRPGGMRGCKSGDAGMRGCGDGNEDVSVDVGQHDAGMAARMQAGMRGSVDAGMTTRM